MTDDAHLTPATADDPGHPHLGALRDRMLAGGAPKYHDANAEKGKLFARERVRMLVDEGSFVEDGLFANARRRGPARPTAS